MTQGPLGKRRIVGHEMESREWIKFEDVGCILRELGRQELGVSYLCCLQASGNSGRVVGLNMGHREQGEVHHFWMCFRGIDRLVIFGGLGLAWLSLIPAGFWECREWRARK